jgi:hypothetical protein
MSVRRHVEHAEPLDERLVQEALRLKEEAKRLGQASDDKRCYAGPGRPRSPPASFAG